MVTEVVYASDHITGGFSNPQDAVGNTPSTWAGDVNGQSSYTSRWSMADPTPGVEPIPGATHTIEAQVRKGSNSGDPTVQVNLYENGTLVVSGPSVSVTSSTGENAQATFTTADITNLNDLEVEIVQTGTGGSPNARNSAQVALMNLALEVQETASDEPPPETPTLSSSGQTITTIQLSWTSSDGADGYELERDASNVYTGPNLSFEDAGLTPETSYQYRVRATNEVGESEWSTLTVSTESDTIEPPPEPDPDTVPKLYLRRVT